MADAHPTSGLVALVDVVFAIVGFSYGVQVLQPLPMTYLSEITFPFDFCVKLASSLVLVFVHSLHWVIDVFIGASWHDRSPIARESPANSSSHALFQMIAWFVSAGLLWMEHRRGRTPSFLLRVFWMFNWIHASVELFAQEHVTRLDLSAPSTLVVVMAALAFLSMAILGSSCFFKATSVTSDCIDIPMLSTPTAFFHSTAGFKLPHSSYGTFGNYDVRSHNRPKHHLPVEQEPMLLPLDRTTLSAVSRASAHSVTRGGAISATIPSSTTSLWGKTHFISYKVVVRTEDDRWTLRRQYGDFATLHDELPAEVKAACPLPEDDNERKFLSWKRHPTPMKTKLETYLQRVLSHKAFEPYSSQALCDFLEMEYIEEALFQSAYSQPLTDTSDFGQAA